MSNKQEETISQSPKNRFLRGRFGWMALLLLPALLAFLAWVAGESFLIPAFLSMSQLSAFLDEHRMAINLIRWSAVGAFLIIWPVPLLSRLFHLSKAGHTIWIEERVRLSAWIIAFELIINTNILKHL